MSGYGVMPLPFANGQVRHGIADGTEVNARAAWAIGSPAGAVGVGLTQRVTPEGAPINASVHVSTSASATVSDYDTDLGFSFHPTVLIGSDRAYVGGRLSIGTYNGEDQVFAGPFAGARFGESEFVGVEVGLMRVTRGLYEDQWLVAPSVTFGLQPDRQRAGQVPEAPALADE